MTAPRFAGLRTRASLAAAKPDPESPVEMMDEDDDETPTTSKKKDKPMAEVKEDAAVVQPVTNANADGVARMKAVFASAAVKGKEGRAADLLADNDFDALSAEAIVKIIASDTAPVADAEEDSTVGKDMLAKMDVKTGDLGADASKPTADAGEPMVSAFAKINKMNGFKA